MTFESSRPLLVSFQELVSFLYYWDLLLLLFSLLAIFLLLLLLVVVASVVEAILSFLVLVKLPRYFDKEERLEVVAAETRVVAAARSTGSDHHPRET